MKELHMSFRTKLLGILFFVLTIALAVVTDIFDWSSWVVGAPALILELGTFVSIMDDLSKN
jgi:hypothetical protein